MCLMTGSSEHSAPQLSHVDESGAARMVDVGGKSVTARRAVASGTVITTPEVMELIASGNLPKGEALPIARIAGIMGQNARGTSFRCAIRWIFPASMWRSALSTTVYTFGPW